MAISFMVAQEELGRTKGGGKRGNIVAHDVSLREQNAKHLFLDHRLLLLAILIEINR